MNHWAALALDSASGFAGAWLAYRFSAKLARFKLLLVLLGVGLAASACFLLPYTSIPSPIRPAFLWKPLVYAAITLIFTAGGTLVGEVFWRSRRTRPAPDSLNKEQPLARVLDLLARGRKIDAIRVHREETGLGLREAKEALEEAQRNLTPALSFSKEREPD